MFQYENNAAIETIFLHSKMDIPHLSKDKRYRIIITPEYYIIKKVPLPVRFKIQAIKMAPSVLEDLAAKDRAYKYFCFKSEDDEWIFIAYSMEQIEDILNVKNIDKDVIEGIYFAQELVDTINKPLPINSGCSLVNIEGIIVCLPYKDRAVPTLEIDTLKLKHKIFSGPAFSVDVSIKKLIAVSLIFFIWGVVLLVQTYEDTKQAQNEIERYQTVLQKQETPKSGYATSNILSEYTKIDKEQSAIRDDLSGFDALLDEKIKIKEIVFENKNIKIVFETKIEHNMQSFEKQAKKMGFAFKTNALKNEISLEVTKVIK